MEDEIKSLQKNKAWFTQASRRKEGFAKQVSLSVKRRTRWEQMI